MRDFIDTLITNGMALSEDNIARLRMSRLTELNHMETTKLQSIIWKKADELRGTVTSDQYLPIIIDWLWSEDGIKKLKEITGNNKDIVTVLEDESSDGIVQTQVTSSLDSFYENTEAVIITLLFIVNAIWLVHEKGLEPSASLINQLLLVLCFLKSRRNE